MTERSKLTARICERTHRAAKLTSIAAGITLGGLVERLLRIWLHDPSVLKLDAPEPPDDLTEILRRAFDEASSRSSDE